MSSSTPERTAAVLTVSDSCSRGEKNDLSGPAVSKTLERRKFRVVLRSVVPDDIDVIQEKLIELCRSARLVVTTGGTGVAPRDVTPEATRAVSDRMVEGIAEIKLKRNYDLTAPQGVNGRNSDNTLIKKYLGWEPCIPLQTGMEKTYA